MALWRDESTPTVQDLRLQESGLLEMAGIENVDLQDKIMAARTEIENELLLYLDENGGDAKTDLGRAVVTSHLHQWLVFHTLSVIYRDAHFNQVSERYKGKWREYASLASEARRNVWVAGIGLVSRALYRPGAPHVAIISGAGAAGSYFVRASWVSASGEESEASVTVSLVKPNTGFIVVTVSGQPSAVTGWNVFVGNSEDSISRQNSSPISVAANWTEPTGGLVKGANPPTGQTPDTYIRKHHIIMRG
jgi:hypothetical protein